ncbi:UNVERIFIED_ORG: type I-B CRISPR-associated protein Cas7/Cst2/DevR [Clostridium botulinum]|uniref:Type I-B CRISPR-associated protein Cas7/Cst2/DevR n=1 Tax=Clostridium botulinum TaxID=1491 RepID=A0A6B4TDA3_CLOBO|nr:type I-B CRISPR-associated protein Cas7/Cst2/DevR [Clostridium botulinum]EES49840.1 CRISPR-associated regulatory protein, DevR family [Clostridium botulinum E1 str. 'BoNT E Beluga']MBN1058777.1 type I-B CRISPR-associated protein Cas7/Cst2/DevR [Clostridium botulinum]MBN1061947.1 type I-B CRISPR-associated protein Cas7/Cst2/DevR [Clostridium botulinum]MBY6762920.1 type I-B CRISPR-associated protein Cas7/Cst2/DevR [Clostridium botulinum]MBY6921745.1 type I-B CRISPR-associated protein Cas7/Cst
MKNVKGLTLSFIFEAESANYGEGIGNVTSLKKISRDGGRAYSYISRQALRYNIINQMKVDNTPLALDGEVLQFHPDASVKDYPEIDLFGYMKTQKPVKTRAAIARLSNAVALETFNADLDFLTNKGLLDRYNENAEKKKDGGNIAQSEIHKSYYTYTITLDLDKVGVDKNDGVEIENSEKAKRVNDLLDVIKFLYRDIKGRRENLSPLFAIGGVYSIKNPFFENRIKCYNNRIQIDAIKDILNLDKEIKENTNVGLINGIFSNNDEINTELNAVEMGQFFDRIKSDINAYYEE